MTLNNIHKIFISPKIFSFMKTPNILKFKILNQKIARAYVCMNISEYPPPLGGKQTDRPKLLLKSEISNISFCLAPLIKVRPLLLPDQRAFRLIRHMCPDYNRLFDPNCKLIFFKYQWLLTPKLSCLSQHTGEIIMLVKTHCRCDVR